MLLLTNARPALRIEKGEREMDAAKVTVYEKRT